MTLLEAVVLGMVQGLTELLPISSSAHLVLVPALLGWDEPSVPLAVALHVGTAAAVCVAFRRDLAELFSGTWRHVARRPRPDETAQRDRDSARMVFCLAVATLPAAVAGVAFKHAVEAAFHSPTAVGGFLLVTALILVAAQWFSGRTKVRDAVTWKQALIVGLAQALALLPGVSRSGATIGAGLALGLEATLAVRFAFLLSLPIILGGGLVEVFDLGGANIPPGELASYAVGALVAALCGWLAIKLVFGAVRTGRLGWYAVYCAVVGSVALLAGLVRT